MLNEPCADSTRCKSLQQQVDANPRISAKDISVMSRAQLQTLVDELQRQNEEHIRVRSELAEARDRYLDVFDSAPVGHMIIRSDCRIERCNLSAAKMLGVDRSEVEDAVLTDLETREDQRCCVRALRMAIESGGEQSWECAIPGPGAGSRYVRIAILPLKMQAPGAGFSVTLTDITARELAEEALRDSNAQLNATLAALPDLLFCVDCEGRIVKHHSVDTSHLYTPVSRFLGKKIADVLPEDAARVIMDAIKAASTTGLHFGAAYSLPMSWGTCWYELSIAATKMPTDASTQFILLARDITAHKRLEVELRANEEQFRARVENLSECIWELDTHGRFTYISPRFLELTGYLPAEYLGKTPGGLIADEDEGVFRGWLLNGAAERGAIPPIQIRVRRKDGQQIDVEFRAARQFSTAGEYLGLRGITQDITDRKQSEKALKRFNETLEQQVQQRTESIRMLRDVAIMANESQDPLQAAQYCLKQLATQLGWLCGHAWWLTADDEQSLSPRCVWYPADTDRWDDFRTVTLQTRLRHNAGLPGRAIAGGRALWATQLQRVLAAPRAAVARQLGLVTAVAAPVFSRGRAVAVLELFSDRSMPHDSRVMDVLTGVTLQLGRIIERREFEEHLLASSEDVRREIAQNLHDDIGQEMTGGQLMVAALAELSPPSTPTTVKLLTDISAGLSRTHEKLRRLCHSAMPRELQEGNLVDALKQLAAFTSDNSHIACDFECGPSEWVFDDRGSTQLYRLAQEAVSNAIRHAGARRIRIAMRHERSDILLTIEDDGKGLPRELPVNHGMGLETMRHRTAMLGGTLELSRAQNGGTCVVCRVPASLRSPSTPARARTASRCPPKS